MTTEAGILFLVLLTFGLTILSCLSISHIEKMLEKHIAHNKKPRSIAVIPTISKADMIQTSEASARNGYDSYTSAKTIVFPTIRERIAAIMTISSNQHYTSSCQQLSSGTEVRRGRITVLARPIRLHPLSSVCPFHIARPAQTGPHRIW